MTVQPNEYEKWNDQIKYVWAMAAITLDQPERFWRFLHQAADMICLGEGSVQQRLERAWKLALGNIQLSDIPSANLQEYLALRAEAVGARLDSSERYGSLSHMTDQDAMDHANRIVRLALDNAGRVSI
ncbi:MAG: hypothetical protein KF784_06140 [Fimbriimonadaceae bacterium]|nr:hypothetical protein [Fimbriimonadaceae bacterium]